MSKLEWQRVANTYTEDGKTFGFVLGVTGNHHEIRSLMEHVKEWLELQGATEMMPQLGDAIQDHELRRPIDRLMKPN